MAEAQTAIANRPAWVDLSSGDPEASRTFYSGLLGWDIEVSPNPEYGGYAIARVGGKDVAGIGPKQMPEAPTAWSVYIGADDAEAVAGKVQAAGGTVVAPAFDVGDQGRMAVFQDPIGAFISVWQPRAMGGFQTREPNTFAWAELNGRTLDSAVPFYQQVFGWGVKRSEGEMPYTEFQVAGESVAGGMEMPPTVPAEVPSHWLVYFSVADVDAATRQAVEAGAQTLAGPMDFPGGRFAVLMDPQGAVFGLLK